MVRTDLVSRFATQIVILIFSTAFTYLEYNQPPIQRTQGIFLWGQGSWGHEAHHLKFISYRGSESAELCHHSPMHLPLTVFNKVCLNHAKWTCSTQSLTHDCMSVLNLISLSHVTMNTVSFATNRTSYWDTLHLWFFTGALIGGLWTLIGFVELTSDRPPISCGTRSMLVLLSFRLVWKSHLFLSMSKWQYISVGL